ncbi:MAG: CRISPR-associated protein Cas5 [Candidatus Schekmanbacteria bacterium]|nr:CRISPR-associated protein Cas5 [Candidatus Schekmanbacteria bacterium]
MRVLSFDLRGAIAHFRRPDTFGTQSTYPIPTPTALSGLAASVLGLPELPERAMLGLELLAPVRTVAQELSLHGKTWVSGGDAAGFSRPTSIELVVAPRYRVHYHGPLLDELSARIRDSRSTYHTYLGAAFCLTFPLFVAEGERPAMAAAPEGQGAITCRSAVPSAAVARLECAEEHQYCRVGGVPVRVEPGRKFRGTTSVLFESAGGPMRIVPRASPDASWVFCDGGDGTWICLW